MYFLQLIFAAFCRDAKRDNIPKLDSYLLSNEEQIFLNKKYIRTLPENKEIYANSLSPISRISGCTFKDIEPTNKSCIIRLDKEVLFYENIFEFSSFDNYIIPVYVSNVFQGKITISCCKFIKCNSIKNNGNVINCIGEADITIESCKFINCGTKSSQAIVKYQANYEHLINFTDCDFQFDNQIFSCYVFKTKSPVNLVFDHCKFFKCPITAIPNEIHSFQFTNNAIDTASKQIIYINYLNFILYFSSNTFKNNVLINSNFIYLNHNLSEISLFNNTFSNTTLEESRDINTIIYLNRFADSKSNLVINECKFINNNNDYGLIQVGDSAFQAIISLNLTKCEFINNICKKRNGGALSVNVKHELSLSGCYFRKNKAFHHGGALALYMIAKAEIISCVFKENIANYFYLSTSSYKLKKEGRGGAIYIHSYSSNMKNDYTKIEKCTFTSNSAFDGYAIYIKGDDDRKKFIIIQNTFNGNYDKSTNFKNKGIITSEILCLNINKIIDLNVFNEKEDNINHLILYSDHTGNIFLPDQTKCIFEYYKNLYDQIILNIIGLTFIIAIIIFSIKITRNTDQDNTFIFVILGDPAIKSFESFNEKKVLKYGNYCFSSLALLIKRLAIKHLRMNEKHICIFGKGTKPDFDITSFLPDNKIITQLTIDEIYETQASQSEIKIKPFGDVKDLIKSMCLFINQTKCNSPNIILFMYDHGDEHSFSNLKFLEFYLRLMDIPHSSLHIYNESCKSNSLISKINKYFAISEVINSFSPKITIEELFFLASVGRKIYPHGDHNHWDQIVSLDNNFFDYICKKDNNTFKCLISLAIDENHQDEIYEKLSPDFSKEIISSIAEIVKCYLSYYNIPEKYAIIHSIFIKGVQVIKEALKKFNMKNAEFMNFIDDLKVCKLNFPVKQYKMHQNHFLITCSHEKNSSPTFSTIRINEKEKIVAGSPVMGSFIIEALMNRSLDQNSVDNIKKKVYGNCEGFIMEYSVPSYKEKQKKWVRLNINYWESKLITERKILLNQNINYMTIKDIMNSIGFELISSCKIEFDENNYCKTKKMQPLFTNSRRINVIGVRLISLKQNYDDNNVNYVDNNDHTNTLDFSDSSNITQASSFENIFDDIDYDMVIPHKYIIKISYEAIKKYEPYPIRFITIFKYEINKISENEKFLNKYSDTHKETPEKIPFDVRLILFNYIRHFFPTYVLGDEIDDFMLFYYKFMVKYHITEEDSKNIFYRCMNIADQVASQLSHADKKQAYNIERLKDF